MPSYWKSSQTQESGQWLQEEAKRMEPALAFAEAALARGDYSQCIQALEELSKEHPLNSTEGSKVRMLMVTAWMGKGDNKKAISICRQLTRSKDNKIREISKQLLR